MEEYRILSVTGCLGYGFPEEFFLEGMKRKPDLVGIDGGSNDGGPYYLGSGGSHCDHEGVRRDLSIILPAVRDAGVPFVVGSASTAGADVHVDTTLGIMKEICKEIGWNAKIAVIRAEIPKELMLEKLRANQASPIDGAPELTEKDIEESVRIVGQMGIEPFVRAIDLDADIILAGRACDTAIFAAYPIKLGFDKALCFHAAKIIECGSACTSPGGGSESILAIIRKEDFLLEVLNSKKQILPMSVAAHSLYEQGHPSKFYEPDGLVDCSPAIFEPFEGSDKCVRVYGTQFIENAENELTLKIEGAAQEGYRCACIVGVRDNFMIKHIDEAIDTVRAYIAKDIGSPEEKGYKVNFRVFGKNAVLGDLEYMPCTTHEIGILIDVLAQTQDMANTICAIARSTTLHTDYAERRTTGGNVAMFFSPHDIPVGPVFRFSIYHIIEGLSNSDFEKLFKIEVVEV